MNAGTLLMQYHRSQSLVHRVAASARNPAPIRMLGIELQETSKPAELCEGHGVRLEFADDQANTYRIQLTPSQSTDDLNITHGAVLTVLAGTGSGDPVGQRQGFPAGSVTWLPAGEVIEIPNTGPANLDCMLTVL